MARRSSSRTLPICGDTQSAVTFIAHRAVHHCGFGDHMKIRTRVLPFVALLMSTGSAFATCDPFDPELFLSPYGEVVTSIITTEVVGAGTSDAGPRRLRCEPHPDP